LASPDLTIVSPTLDERDNVGPLAGIAWEIVFVDDDSADGTAEVVKAMARADTRVRCIRRVGRRGLAGAAIEGFLSSSAPYVALIDADLQHDETALRRMFEALTSGDAELAIGSRHVAGGSSAGLSSQARVTLSDLGGWLANRVTRVPVSDPMSGFFMARREVIDAVAPKLSGQGFKILTDILASSERPLRVVEVGYGFRERLHGTSKLDTGVLIDYATLLADKTIGRFVPVRFLMFAAIGALGVFVHLGMLWLVHLAAGASFALGQGIAAFTAMTTNFLLNNLLTFRDRRLKGRALVTGLLSFYAVCSVGFVANVGVGDFLFGQGQRWWIAGVAGALVAAVWNYAASSVFTWGRKR
jgi:dolichol-phosphate mannosyltransferase